MKATKYTMTITVEVLSLDSVSALLSHIRDEIDNEVIQGKLTMSDGDTVAWQVETDDVLF